MNGQDPMRRYFYCLLICAVSLYILLTMPFPTDNSAGDLLSILQGIIDIVNGY